MTPPPEKKPDPSRLIEKAINAPGCGQLALRRRADGSFLIKGFLGSARELARVKDKIAAVPTDRPVTYDVTFYPWPQCEALQTFAPPLATPQGLSISVVSQKMPALPTLHEGDFLKVRVTTPNFPSYVYVTYLQAGGDAVHLIRPAATDAPLGPNEEIVFGVDARRERFKIAEPFGVEMLVAVATRKPLFDERKVIVEQERQFLSAFRQAILQKLGTETKGLAAAAFAQLRTQSK